MHITKIPESGNIFLPKLSGFKVVNSEDISGHTLSVKQVDGGYRIDMKTLEKIESPVVLELTVDKNLTTEDVESSKELSGYTVGKVLNTGKITSGKLSEIKLDGIRTIKSLKFDSSYNMKGNIILSFSKNGKTWEQQAPVTISEKTIIMPVTSYVAGALLDGKNAKYVKVEFSENVTNAISYTVYGE